MNTIEKILSAAHERAKASDLPYEGALLPQEAQSILEQDSHSRIIDVRTQAEWEWVGRVPNSTLIEWNTWPGGQPNPGFIDQLRERVPDLTTPVLFLCRSGGRSHNAAIAATRAGYTHCFNILQGFEGDKDANGRRNSVGGWRFAGLPWLQG